MTNSHRPPRRSILPRRRPRRFPAALLAASLALAACGGDGFGGGGGATPGGVKDLGLARALVAAGQVPPPEALLVEGMFAEHDLPLAGAPCDAALCGRLGLGLAPDEQGARTAWLQVGLSSAIDPGTWQRPPTTFIMTVDVSGSMGWTSSDDGESPGQLARRLLRQIGDTLGPSDRVAIVTYGRSVKVALPRTAGDAAAYGAAIERLGTDGSTNMEAGLELAYALARAAQAEGDTAQTRVLLFTDALPNVGATAPSAFERMARAAGDEGIGLTVLALGLGLGADVTKALAQVRGANAFTFFSDDDVGAFLGDEWPLCTTPIAYDLTVDLDLSDGAELVGAYGFPQGSGARPGLQVATAFLSRRRGALLVALRPAHEQFTVGMTLSYRSPDGVSVSTRLTAAYDGAPLDARQQYFDQASTARATALALLVAGMRRAAMLYGVEPEDALATMRATHTRFVADAAALGDARLEREVAFSAALLALIEAGAPQAL